MQESIINCTYISYKSSPIFLCFLTQLFHLSVCSSM